MPDWKWAAVGALSVGLGIYSGAFNAAIGLFALYIECQKNKLVRRLRPKRIIIMRHAESEGNVDKNLFQSIPDNAMSLSGLGHQQALDAGKRLKEMLKDETVFCFVSPFRRALETLSGVLESFDYEQVVRVQEDSRLREQEWGNFQNPVLLKKIHDERMQVGRFWYRFSTGESGADVFGRADAFMDTLYRTLDAVMVGRKRVDNVLIVTHGLTARFLLMRYFRWSVSTFESVCNIKNAEFWVLKKDANGKYQISTDEGDEIRSYMNVTVEFVDGFTRQMTIPNYITLKPPRKLDREEILKRLGLKQDEVARIDFHPSPHVKDPASRGRNNSQSEVEVEVRQLIHSRSLQVFPEPVMERTPSKWTLT